MAHTVKGPKFVEGETVATPDGLKFVVGVTLSQSSGGDGTSENEEKKFVCGTLVDAGGERAQFMQVEKSYHPIVLISSNFEI